LIDPAGEARGLNAKLDRSRTKAAGLGHRKEALQVIPIERQAPELVVPCASLRNIMLPVSMHRALPDFHTLPPSTFV
jgi:hypothetical protein